MRAALEGELDALKRIIGCAVFCYMPPNGLEPALETLREEYKYACESLGMAQPSEREIVTSTGKIVLKKERHDLVVAE